MKSLSTELKICIILWSRLHRVIMCAQVIKNSWASKRACACKSLMNKRSINFFMNHNHNHISFYSIQALFDMHRCVRVETLVVVCVREDREKTVPVKSLRELYRSKAKSDQLSSFSRRWRHKFPHLLYIYLMT